MTNYRWSSFVLDPLDFRIRMVYTIGVVKEIEMLKEFNSRNGEIDVVDVVESTIKWALNLPYSKAKNIRIAFKALSKKGVMSNEAFIPALDITLTLRGLNKYMDKYLPKYIQDYKSVG